MKNVIRLLAVVLLVVAPTQVAAQGIFDRLSNPKFRVTLTHPPKVVLKGVQKISVDEFGGQCGLELSERMFQALADSNEFEMIDRSYLRSVLAEQGFQSSGAVGEQSAVRLGQLLGPAAMFAGTVTRCTVVTSEPLVAPGRYTDSQGRPATKYIRRVTAQLTASVRLVDFTTGKSHAGQLVEARVELVNEAFNGYPEAPDREAVTTLMYRDASNKLMKVIKPWTEVVEIIVYDDDNKDRFQLKPATLRMKAGDFVSAAIELDQLIQQGGGPKTNDKDRAKAYYDLGLAQMYANQTGEGVRNLQRALGLWPGNSIIEDGLAAARQKHRLELEYEALERNAVELGKEAQAAVDAEQAQVAAATLTNQDILDLVKAKMPDAVILAKMKTGPCRLDKSTEALVALKTAGASDDVIIALTERQCLAPLDTTAGHDIWRR